MEAAVIWFNIGTAPGVGPTTFQAIWTSIHARSIAPQSLTQLGAEELAALLAVKPSIAHSIAERLAAPLAVPTATGTARTLVAGDEHFPSARLASACPPLPPVLWATGEVSLLGRTSSLGVAGSRDAADTALDVAGRIGRGASLAGVTVVSGMAAGIDTAAHVGALDGQAGTIGVLASGIGRHRGRLTPRGDEPLCLVSEFAPDVEWSGRHAMQRNSTIAALSDRVVVVAAGLRGGSWEMAQLCAKRGKHLFVVDFDEQVAPGNRELIESLGAIAVAPDEIERCWLEPVVVSPGDAPRTPLASRR